MKKIINNFLQTIINSPYKILLIGFALVAITLPGLIYIESDFSYKGYYKSDHELISAFNEFEKIFGGDDRIAIVMHSPSGIFHKNNIEKIWKITDEMWEVSDIIRVDSLTNHNWVTTVKDDLEIAPFIDEENSKLTSDFLIEKKIKALNDHVLPNYLISKDSKTTMIIGRFRPIFDGKVGYQQGIKQIRSIIKKHSDNSDTKFFLAGNAMVNQVFKEVSTQDMKLIMPLLAVIIILLLLFIFRSISGVLLPLCVIILSVAMTFSMAGYLGIKYSNIIAAIPIILVAISIADTIHLLLSYRRMRNDGYNVKDAASQAFSKNLLPTFLTSLSTSIGFISLSGSQLLPIAGLGLLGALGSLFAWLLTYLIAAPLIIITEKKDNKKANTKVMTISLSFITTYINWLNKWKIAVISISILFSIGAIYIALQNEVNSDPLIYLSKKVPFRIATEFMDENLGGASGVEIMLNSNKPDGIKDPEFVKGVEKLTNWLKQRDFYSKVISYVDIVKEMNKNLNEGNEKDYTIPKTKEEIGQALFLYGLSVPQGKDLNDQITIDSSAIRISGLWTIHSSSKILKEIDLINLKIKELGMSGVVTGKMPIYHNMNRFVVQTFFVSILSALSLIGLMMIILFRSLRLGIISMIPNVVPLIFGAAFMAILQKPLDIGTVIIGAICLGIAIDDTIHFLVTYIKYKENYDKLTALSHVLHSTGVALIGTTLVLILGFSTFILGSFVPNSNLGMGTALILFIALVVDLVLLPAIILSNKKI